MSLTDNLSAHLTCTLEFPIKTEPTYWQCLYETSLHSAIGSTDFDDVPLPLEDQDIPCTVISFVNDYQGDIAEGSVVICFGHLYDMGPNEGIRFTLFNAVE